MGFSVRHLVISQVRGQLTNVAGTVALDEADPTRSTVEATIDAASIQTQVADRDAHLKSPDFLDTVRYPTITFKSTKIAKAGKDAYQVTGDLTLDGVTRPVTLDATVTPEVKGMYGETAAASPRRPGSRARTSASPGTRSSRPAPPWATRWPLRSTSRP